MNPISRPRTRRLALAALCLAAACTASAQIFRDPDPDWKEGEVPQPPAFDIGRMVEMEVQRSSALKSGVDPQTITVSPQDGVVRYVLIAHSGTGVVNASYEGLRCASGEYKVYARHNGNGWNVYKADWKSLDDARSRHSKTFAQMAACDGRSVRGSAQDIERALRQPYRYGR